jgi:hypothetical protein
MQLAALHTSPAPVRTTPEPQLRNVFLTSSIATDNPSVMMLRSVMVAFDATADTHYGGHVSTTRMVDGRASGIQLRAYLNRPAERAAAQSVEDAIRASGLLDTNLPPLDWKHPAAGRTRLYLDRRSHFLEYETGKPPAVAQPVLDALEAYQRIARGGIAS